MTYTPGHLFVVRTRGPFGWIIRIVTRSKVSHAGIIVNKRGRTVEAKARGAVVGDIAKYAGRYMLIGPAVAGASAEDLAFVAHEATLLLGTPYGFLDILSVGLLQFGWIRRRVQSGHAGWFLSRLRRRVESEDRLICSQLADLAYRNGLLPIFTDGRLPMDVTPGDEQVKLLAVALDAPAH